MAARSREEALFGAAVLVRRLEVAGLSAEASEIARGVVEDLGLTWAEVDRYLQVHRVEVDAALAGAESEP